MFLGLERKKTVFFLKKGAEKKLNEGVDFYWRRFGTCGQLVHVTCRNVLFVFKI